MEEQAFYPNVEISSHLFGGWTSYKTSCGAALVRINDTAELCGDSFRAVIYYKSRV